MSEKPSVTASGNPLVEYAERKSFWRCGVCGRELKQLISGRDSEPHACSGTAESPHRPTIMRYVEQERVYPSVAAWRLLSTFDKSDWGLIEQAVAHYAKNRRRTARSRPGLENAMRSVFERFDAIQRACNWLKREAPREYEVGGSNVEFAADAESGSRSAFLDVIDVLRKLHRDVCGHRAPHAWDRAEHLIDTALKQAEAAQRTLFDPLLSPDSGTR